MYEIVIDFELSSNVCNCPKLRVLTVYKPNSMIGSIPECIENLKQLAVIELLVDSANEFNLTGILPSKLFRLPNLISLAITNAEKPELQRMNSWEINEKNDNFILPQNIYLPKLKTIMLSNIGLSGTIPLSICSMTAIKYFINLKTIISKTNCKIVISSTWRMNPRNRSQLLDSISRFCKYTNEQVNDLIIGDTPDLVYTDDPMKSRGLEIKFCRAHEIDSFLRSKQIKNKYNVISWVTLDDTELDSKNLHYYASDIMKDHFVRTDPLYCLTQSDADKAIGILNKTTRT